MAKKKKTSTRVKRSSSRFKTTAFLATPSKAKKAKKRKKSKVLIKYEEKYYEKKQPKKVRKKKNAGKKKSRKKKTKGQLYIGVKNRTSYLHVNHLEVAANLKRLTDQGIRCIWVFSSMQSGKTGIIEALAQRYKALNVRFISALPYLENRLQDLIRLENAGVEVINKYLLDTLMMTNGTLCKPNSILCVDEAQFGSGEGGMISKLLKEYVKKSVELNQTLITFSATVFDQHFAIEWNQLAEKVHVGSDYNEKHGYRGISKFLQNRQVIDNEGQEKIVYDGEISPLFTKAIQDFLGQRERFVFPIRCPGKDNGVKRLDTVVSYLCNKFKFNNGRSGRVLYLHNQNDSFPWSEIDSFGSHTIVMVDQLFKAGMTIENKSNLFSIWENMATMTAHVQGLPGRTCGYDRNSHIKIYANLKMLQAYSHYEKYGSLPGDFNDISREEKRDGKKMIKVDGRVTSRGVPFNPSLKMTSRGLIEPPRAFKRKSRYSQIDLNLIRGHVRAKYHIPLEFGVAVSTTSTNHYYRSQISKFGKVQSVTGAVRKTKDMPSAHSGGHSANGAHVIIENRRNKDFKIFVFSTMSESEYDDYRYQTTPKSVYHHLASHMPDQAG